MEGRMYLSYDTPKPELTPQPRLASGSYRKITWVTTKLPRCPPKGTSRFITKLGLLQNDEAQSLLKRLIPLLTRTAEKPSSLAEVASICFLTERNIAEQNFLHMRSLLQFTLWIE
jgi:hypothetical protein